MDVTKNHVTVYGVTLQQANDFEFDYRGTPDSDLISQLVPNTDDWGGIGWIELEEYEYDRTGEQILLTINTKRDPPAQWLQHASQATHHFENRLMVMTSAQKDETRVTGIAVMDGETLQNKQIFTMDPSEVEKHYSDSDEPGYDLEDLDDKIWDSIKQFVNICEQFYLEKDNENDD